MAALAVMASTAALVCVSCSSVVGTPASAGHRQSLHLTFTMPAEPAATRAYTPVPASQDFYFDFTEEFFDGYVTCWNDTTKYLQNDPDNGSRASYTATFHFVNHVTSTDSPGGVLMRNVEVEHHYPPTAYDSRGVAYNVRDYWGLTRQFVGDEPDTPLPSDPEAFPVMGLRDVAFGGDSQSYGYKWERTSKVWPRNGQPQFSFDMYINFTD